MSVLVSVVVPTFRRPALLARCLDALLAQTLHPALYEIVVADDAPAEAVQTLVDRLQARGRCALRYVPVRETQGAAGARNAGWRAASGEIIAFTDDDTVPDRRWLLAGLHALAAGASAVTGRIEMPLPQRPTDYEKDAAGLTRAEFVTANCFVRRDVLERIGGFDERFTSAWREDSDLHFRLLEAGCRIERAPDALVVHPVREAGFGVSLAQQRKVVFDALLYRKHPRLYRQRIRRMPPIEYYVAAASVLAAILATATGRPLGALVALVPWLLVTLYLTSKRLRGTTHSPRHVAEMAITSAAIPLASVFWRSVASVRHRVLFL
ncbi:MAG: glycosyltransferase [Burkholderiaceae bacterium]|nr:glycosyltransferase [Burkholderiaceae bacterium]